MYLTLSLSINPSIYLSIYLSPHLYLSTYLSIYQSMYLSITILAYREHAVREERREDERRGGAGGSHGQGRHPARQHCQIRPRYMEFKNSYFFIFNDLPSALQITCLQ